MLGKVEYYSRAFLTIKIHDLHGAMCEQPFFLFSLVVVLFLSQYSSSFSLISSLTSSFSSYYSPSFHFPLSIVSYSRRLPLCCNLLEWVAFCCYTYIDHRTIDDMSAHFIEFYRCEYRVGLDFNCCKLTNTNYSLQE